MAQRLAIFDEWMQDPEFAALSRGKKQDVLNNYFDRYVSDDEFRGLPESEQGRLKGKIFNNHLGYPEGTESIPVPETVPQEESATGGMIGSALESTRSGFRGLAAGSAGLGEMAGTAVEWLGNRLPESVGGPVSDVGRKVADYYEKEGKGWAPPEELQGSVWDNPGLLADGRWWAYNVGQFAPSMIAAMAPGLAAKGVIEIGGKALSLTPEVIERIASLGMAVGSGAGAGAMEGTGTYREMLRDGKSEQEASAAGVVMAGLCTGLNSLGFGAMFSKVSPLSSMGKRAAKHVFASGTEGITEALEEPSEEIAKAAAHYLETGEMIPDLPKKMGEAIRDRGLNVLGPAALMGGGMSVIAGYGGKLASDSKLDVAIRKGADMAADPTTQEYKALLDSGEGTVANLKSFLGQIDPEHAVAKEIRENLSKLTADQTPIELTESMVVEEKPIELTNDMIVDQPIGLPGISEPSGKSAEESAIAIEQEEAKTERVRQSPEGYQGLKKQLADRAEEADQIGSYLESYHSALNEGTPGGRFRTEDLDGTQQWHGETSSYKMLPWWQEGFSKRQAMKAIEWGLSGKPFPDSDRGKGMISIWDAALEGAKEQYAGDIYNWGKEVESDPSAIEGMTPIQYKKALGVLKDEGYETKPIEDAWRGYTGEIQESAVKALATEQGLAEEEIRSIIKNEQEPDVTFDAAWADISDADRAFANRWTEEEQIREEQNRTPMSGGVVETPQEGKSEAPSSPVIDEKEKPIPKVKKEVIVEAEGPDVGLNKTEGQVHDYSSTQVNLPEPDAKAFHEFGSKIPDAEIYEDPKDPSYGREDEPHITVKYGLDTVASKEVEPLLADQGPITAKMGKVSIFESDDYDVVKVDIESPELHALNKKISDNLKVTDTYPDYKPHATIAYVKKGEGQKYVGDTSFEGKEVVFNSLTFSGKDGNLTEIPLKGEKLTSVIPTPEKIPAKKAEPKTPVKKKEAGPPIQLSKGGSQSTRAVKTTALPDSLSKAFAMGKLSKLKDAPGTDGNKDYQRAKYHGDVEAADRVAVRMLNEKKLAALNKILDPDKPILFVPVVNSEKNNQLNVLPHSYAKNLARAFKGRYCEDIVKTSGKPNTDATLEDRVTREIEFDGSLPEGDFQVVIVDDNFTSGKTTMALLGHLQGLGADVRAVTTMAYSARNGAQIKPTENQLDKIREYAKVDPESQGKNIDDYIREVTGHGINQYTGAEANAVAKKRSKQTFRSFYPARDVAEGDVRLGRNPQEKPPTRKVQNALTPSSRTAKTREAAPGNLKQLKKDVLTWLEEALPPEAMAGVRAVLTAKIDLTDKNTEASTQQWKDIDPSLTAVMGAATVDPFKALVELSYNFDNATIQENTYHEAFHISSKWLLPDADYARLLKFYGGEEKAAIAFQTYAMQRAAGKGHTKGRIRQIFDTLIRALTAVRNGLNGKGFSNPESVYEKILNKEYPMLSKRDRAQRVYGTETTTQLNKGKEQDPFDPIAFVNDLIAKPGEPEEEHTRKILEASNLFKDAKKTVSDRFGKGDPHNPILSTDLDNAKSVLGRTFNDAMYWIVDKNRPIATVQKHMDKVEDKIDVFLKETQRPKITAARVRNAWDEHIRPLMDKMVEYKVNVQDLELYKHALHAPEANDALRKANAKSEVEKIKEVFVDEKRDLRKAIKESKNEMDVAALKAASKAVKDINQRVDGLEKPPEWYDALNGIIDAYENESALKTILEKWAAFSEKPSGMTDKESAEILERYKGDKKIERLGRMLDVINDNKLQLLYDSGLIPKEEYEAVSNKYEHYVPLYREGFDDSLFGVSRGLRPSGRQIKVRGGSTRMVKDILAHSIANYEKAINAAEKARSQRALLGLIRSNRDSDIIKASPVKKSPRHDSNGNLRMYPDLFNVADNEMRLMVDGKQHLVSVDRDNKDAMLMLRTLKAEDNMGGPLVNFLSKINRFLAKVNTTWSPEFIISNFMRDIQTAGINIQDTGVKGKGMLKGAKDAWGAIYATERGKPKGTELEGYYERFKASGGKIGWSDVHGSVENLTRQITSEIEMKAGERPVRKRIHDWLQFIEDVNTSIENGIRLHVFKLAVDQGMTDERAAQVASDLTVDFTKKGAAGPVINSLYLFANAGIQGSYRIIRAASKSKQVRKTLAGIIGAGFAVGVFNALAGGEDDDDEDYFNKIEEFIRERNMIIMLPGTKGKYVKIPLPWGYNLFWNIGSEISRAFTKEDFSALSSAGRLASTFANAFNPVASGTLLQTLSPTVTDPFAQVAENKNWFGGPLMPEQNKFAKVKTPDSQRYWKSTGTASKWVASRLNSLTGGDKVKSGLIDVSPETLDLIVDSVGGSALKFVKDVLGVPLKAVQGEEVKMSKIPFLRRVAGEKSEWADSKTYFENSQDVFVAAARLKAYRGTPNYRNIIEATKLERALMLFTKNTEKKLRLLRSRLKRAEVANNKKAVEITRALMNAIYVKYNRRYSVLRMAIGNQHH